MAAKGPTPAPDAHPEESDGINQDLDCGFSDRLFDRCEGGWGGGGVVRLGDNGGVQPCCDPHQKCKKNTHQREGPNPSPGARGQPGGHQKSQAQAENRHVIEELARRPKLPLDDPDPKWKEWGEEANSSDEEENQAEGREDLPTQGEFRWIRSVGGHGGFRLGSVDSHVGVGPHLELPG